LILNGDVKGKPVERRGRKATGLRDRVRRQRGCRTCCGVDLAHVHHRFRMSLRVCSASPGSTNNRGSEYNMKLNRRTFLAGTTGLAAAWAFPSSGAPQLVFDDGFENGIDNSSLYGKSTNGEGTLEAVTTRSREGGRSLHTRIVHSGTNNFRQEVAVRTSLDGSSLSG